MKFVMLTAKPIADEVHIVDAGEPVKGIGSDQAMPSAVLPFEQATGVGAVALDVENLLEGRTLVVGEGSI